MSRDALVSGTTGMTASVLLTVNTTLITTLGEVFIVGIVGGAAGLLGKMLVQFIISKIKSKFNKTKNEKS